MDIALWAVSGILAVLYLGAGIVKTVRTREQLAPMLGWVRDAPVWSVKAIGIAEILGAIGLVVPWLTGIAPVLTPLAAVGLVIVQIGAIPVHLRRGEGRQVPANVVLLLAALFVAVFRFAQL